MTLRLLVLSLSLLLCAACAPLRGPDADLHAIATPDSAPETVAVLQPSPGPAAGQGQWRAWVPRYVAPGGDVTDGHWLLLSADPPVLEVEPAKPMPRAPKPTLNKPTPALAHQPSPGGSQPPPVMPQGMSPLAGPVIHRVQQIPMPRQGGQ